MKPLSDRLRLVEAMDAVKRRADDKGRAERVFNPAFQAAGRIGLAGGRILRGRRPVGPFAEMQCVRTSETVAADADADEERSSARLKQIRSPLASIDDERARRAIA